MHLTARQRDFLNKLIDIYRQENKPVHYIDLAAELGISKWTAYDMMTVLERKGIVTREYAVGQSGSGGGRSQVLFRPTNRGRALLEDMTGNQLDEQEWLETKDRILAALEQAPEGEYQALAEELLQTIDSRAFPQAYWATGMTVLLLTVKDIRARIKEIPLFQGILERIRSPRARLLALAEVGESLPKSDMNSVELRKGLHDFLSQYDTLVDQIETVKQRALLGFLGKVLERLGKVR